MDYAVCSVLYLIYVITPVLPPPPNLGKLHLSTGRPWARAELGAYMAGPHGEQLIGRLRQVLDYFHPKWHWIENPWLSRMRDYITEHLPHVCVDYCQCSDWGV